MKTKQCQIAIKDLISDIYLCIFDNQCNSDDLMKYVVKSLDFFKYSCCSIKETTSLITQSLQVAFKDNDIKKTDELAKSSLVSKIIGSINFSVIEYLKINTADKLVKQCEDYLISLMDSKSSFDYNYRRLQNLISIMKELLRNNMLNISTINWTVTSFIFHIVYVNITSVLIKFHILYECIHSNNGDSVELLARVFDSKRQFVELILINLLPKIIALNTNIDNNVITFNGSIVSNEIYNPIFELLSYYNSNSLTVEYMKRFILNHSHQLIIYNNEVIKAGKIPNSGSSTSLNKLSVSSLNKSESTSNINLEDVNKLVDTVVGQNKTKNVKIDESLKRLPNDKDYRKILMMKFFYLIEKCIHAYKEKTTNTNGNTTTINIYGPQQLLIDNNTVRVKTENSNNKK